MAARAGIALAVTAYASLAIEAIVIHRVGDRVGTLQIALLRGLGCAVLMLLVSAATGRLAIRSRSPRVQATRSVLGAVGFLAAIYAFAHAPLVDATALTYTRALWMILFAALTLGEVAGLRRWLGVVIGLAGAIAIIRPGFSEPAALGYAAAISGAALGAAAAVASKRAIQIDSVNTTMWWVTGANLVVAAPAIPSLDPELLPELGVIMIVGPLGTYLLLWALAHAAVSMIAPFEYTRLVVQSLAALILFHEVPSGWAWWGMAAIVAGCSLQMKGREWLTLIHTPTRWRSPRPWPM